MNGSPGRWFARKTDIPSGQSKTALASENTIIHATDPRFGVVLKRSTRSVPPLREPSGGRGDRDERDQSNIADVVRCARRGRHDHRLRQLHAGTANVASHSVPTASSAASASALATASSSSPNARNPASIGSMIPRTDLDGEVYGFVRAVDPAAALITLDKIDGFTGAAAQQACAADVPRAPGRANRDPPNYYRNVNPAVRVVAVSPQETITTLDGTAR